MRAFASSTCATNCLHASIRTAGDSLSSLHTNRCRSCRKCSTWASICVSDDVSVSSRWLLFTKCFASVLFTVLTLPSERCVTFFPGIKWVQKSQKFQHPCPFYHLLRQESANVSEFSHASISFSQPQPKVSPSTVLGKMCVHLNSLLM